VTVPNTYAQFPSRTRLSHQMQQLTEQHKISWTSVPIFITLALFCPIANESAGTWHNMAIELTREIGRRINMVTEDTKETTYLLQNRLPVARQKGNAVTFQNTVLTE